MIRDPAHHEPPKADLAEASAAIARAWQEIARHSADIAAARRSIFLAYVAEGFSEPQALELIKSL